MKNISKKSKVCNNNIMLISMFIILFIVMIFVQRGVVHADAANTYTKSYMTYEIQQGDTLTSIANTYMKPGQKSVDYIDEVIYTNNLTDEHIHAGCYLLIPTYAKEE